MNDQELMSVTRSTESPETVSHPVSLSCQSSAATPTGIPEHCSLEGAGIPNEVTLPTGVLLFAQLPQATLSTGNPEASLPSIFPLTDRL